MGRDTQRGDEAKAAFWRGMMDEQRTSGLSIRAFCVRRELSEPGFHWWRRRLGHRRQRMMRGRASARRPAVSLPQRRPKTRPERPVPFASVQVMAVSAIEIVLARDVRVLVPPGTTGPQLREVLSALETFAPRPAAE